MNKRALVIGYGGIGAKRSRILRDLGWEVTIDEPDQTRRMVALADGFTDIRYGEPWLVNDRFDVAFVCSPPVYHARHAVVCLRVAHVFIEKPIAHTMQDAQLICDAAADSDRQVMVGCNYRFSRPWPTVLLPHVRIEIVFAYDLSQARPDWLDSYVNDPVQGGVVLDSGIHAIDLAQDLKKGNIVAVELAEAGPSLINAKVETSATFGLTHSSGVVSQIEVDWTGPDRRTITFHSDGQYSRVPLWDETDGMWKRETRAFLDAVTSDQPPPNGPVHAMQTLRWCLVARDMVRKQELTCR